jgi:hypothetical protein
MSKRKPSKSRIRVGDSVLLKGNPLTIRWPPIPTNQFLKVTELSTEHSCQSGLVFRIEGWDAWLDFAWIKERVAG